MTKVQKGENLGNGGNGKTEGADQRLTPYYEWHDQNPVDTERILDLNELVWFDVHQTQERLWAWLKTHADRDPPPSGGEATKVQAIQAASNQLREFEWMYGPERIAERRWFKALGDLLQTLSDFAPYAVVRAKEDSYTGSKIRGNAASRTKAKGVTDLTREIRDMALALLTKVRDAKQKIPTWKDDPLPGLERTKKDRLYLARMEARLSIAGFKYKEIGRLLPDLGRIQDDERRNRNAETAHVGRMRVRASKLKPEIAEQTRSDLLAEMSIDAFSKKIGRDIHKWNGADIEAWTKFKLAYERRRRKDQR